MDSAELNRSAGPAMGRVSGDPSDGAGGDGLVSPLLDRRGLALDRTSPEDEWAVHRIARTGNPDSWGFSSVL